MIAIGMYSQQKFSWEGPQERVLELSYCISFVETKSTKSFITAWSTLILVLSGQNTQRIVWLRWILAALLLRSTEIINTAGFTIQAGYCTVQNVVWEKSVSENCRGLICSRWIVFLQPVYAPTPHKGFYLKKFSQRSMLNNVVVF